MQLNERLYPLVDAIERASGQRVSISTALRWCQRGTSGVRLESWKLGGRRLTSVEAVERFMMATTRISGSLGRDLPRDSKDVSRAHQEALRRLDDEGL